MKMRKVLAMACALALTAAIAVGGTLAYLTSTTEVVKNTFTVGNVKITLDEKNTDGKDAEGKANPTVERDNGNEYFLMPGRTFEKDPTVHIDADSEDCYVRMFVRIENYATLLEKMGASTLPEEFAAWNSTYWTCHNYIQNGDDAVLEFRHNAIITASDDVPALFTSITLPGTVTDLTGLDTVQIKVTAEAIQADGFTTPDKAFEALDAAKA